MMMKIGEKISQVIYNNTYIYPQVTLWIFLFYETSSTEINCKRQKASVSEAEIKKLGLWDILPVGSTDNYLTA